MNQKVQAMKADADEQIGRLTQRLNDCGPRGNRSVEMQLDFQRGRSNAFAEVLDLLTVASR